MAKPPYPYDHKLTFQQRRTPQAKEPDECTKGRSCGLACISMDKDCLKDLSPEMAALAARVRDVLRAGGLGIGFGASGQLEKFFDDPDKDAGWQKFLSEIKRVDGNLKRANDFKNQQCKGGANTTACTAATEAAKKADMDHKHMQDYAIMVERSLNITERDDPAAARIRQDQFDGLTNDTNKKNMIDYSTAINDKAKQYAKKIAQLEANFSKSGQDPNVSERRIGEYRQRKAALDNDLKNGKIGQDTYDQDIYDLNRFYKKEREELKKFPNDAIRDTYYAERKRLFDAYDKEVENLAKKHNIPYYNDTYVSAEMAESFYLMAPQALKTYMGGAGSVKGTGVGMNTYDYGTEDFDPQTGLYTGGKGRITDSYRTQAPARDHRRGMVTSDMILRSKLQSIQSKTQYSMADTELEHINGLTGREKYADQLGNTGMSGSVENRLKGGQTNDVFLGPKGAMSKYGSAQDINDEKDAKATTKGGAAGRAQAYVNKPENERVAHAANSVNNDPAAMKNFKTYVENQIFHHINSNNKDVNAVPVEYADVADWKVDSNGKIKVTMKGDQTLGNELKNNAPNWSPDSELGFLVAMADVGSAKDANEFAKQFMGGRRNIKKTSGRGTTGAKISVGNTSKIMSAAWAVGTDAQRKQIEQLHNDAMDAANDATQMDLNVTAAGSRFDPVAGNLLTGQEPYGSGKAQNTGINLGWLYDGSGLSTGVPGAKK